MAEMRGSFQAEHNGDSSPKTKGNSWSKTKKLRHAETMEDATKLKYGFSRIDSCGRGQIEESCQTLMTAGLIEYSEDHLTGARYISANTLLEQKN